MIMRDENDVGKKSREIFQRKEDSLDQETLKRLESIRHQAVSLADKKQYSWIANLHLERMGEILFNPQGSVRTGSMLTAITAMLLLVIIIVNYQFTSMLPVDDLMILTSGEDLELIEDLDFYDWLLEVDNNG